MTDKKKDKKCIFSREEHCRKDYAFLTVILCDGLKDKARCPFWQKKR